MTKGSCDDEFPLCGDITAPFALEMVESPDVNKRDVVCHKLVNNTETWPFRSCGQTVVQHLMFKEKGGAVFGKKAF